ncbi:uncharacterized protein KY384_003152 [Bacidia gigantensis]|uniref:uncharacterized protein n=1 Tax=Bacidia gigantensis TaxID=2732470 RepID=UPI001D04D7CB|nr:uncharacterized protein KY384_003152 [Bacidia gigantensis]KAG8531523.1 hypothetical protein KY384_003152 [Bacidia gigantensis]
MKGQKHLTIVIKLGTSSIVSEKNHEPLLSVLSLIVETAVQLVKDGHKVVIVSSGAIGMGLRRMKALASVGQCQLIGLWNTLFAHLQQPIAQILLTRNDIADRTQYLNAQNTFTELFNMGVIPIVNENDTIAVSEIREVEKFGDNDTLSAITAAMLQADYLFLMTDVDCLYDKNPRMHADARPIDIVEDISALEADVSSAGSALGTGGMSTKIVAARLAISAGVTAVITRSSKPGNIIEVVNYVESLRRSPLVSSLPLTPSTEREDLSKSTASLQMNGPLRTPPLHTRFIPDLQPIRDRSFWLLHGLAPHGTMYIDEGAHQALKSRAGLLPVGIVDVEGQFAQQEAVRLLVVKQKSNGPLESDATVNGGGVPVDIPSAPLEVGRALVNYSSAEIMRIKGCQSTEIRSLLGFADSEYVALRENVSLARNEKSRPVTPISRRRLTRLIRALTPPMKKGKDGEEDVVSVMMQ